MPADLLSIPDILQVRNKYCEPGRSIYFLLEEDSIGTELNKFIRLYIERCIGDEDSVGVLPHRLGILYKFTSGHVTPLLIEFREEIMNSKESDDETRPFFRIYSTDSRSFDVQDGEELRQVILELSDYPFVEVYALGLDPMLYDANKNTVRQHTETGCDIFSIIDLEILLRVFDIKSYFAPHIQPLNKKNCFQITQLPPNMMLYSQSINGNERDNRQGLKHYIKDNAELADIPFTLLDCSMSVDSIFSIDGYFSIVNGLSNVNTPLTQLRDAIDLGLADTNLSVGEKKITLRALHDWHVRHNEKSFMADMFHIICGSFTHDITGTKAETNRLPWAVFSLLKHDRLFVHAANFNEYGPKTDLVEFEQTVAPVPEDIRTDASAQDAVAAALFDSVITLFARSVFVRTPERSRLLDQTITDVLRQTPYNNSRDRSPEMPPAGLATELLAESFRLFPSPSCSSARKSREEFYYFESPVFNAKPI